MNERLGRHNPIVRRLRSLRRDGALRKEENVFVAEGIHLVQEALTAGSSIEFVLASERLTDREEGRSLLASARAKDLVCHFTTSDILDSLQDARSAQPVLAVVRRPEWPVGSGVERARALPLVTVACGVQDPGNLGAMLRTTHAAGGSAFFVCGASADLFHPRAVRGSMGSIFRMPAAEADTDRVLEQLRGNGIVTVGADPSAETRYLDCDLTRPTALFFGSEGGGLPAALLTRLDETTRIPLPAGVDSLSVGSAAAVLLFEAARQRASSRSSL